jgi:hypothetical protein
MKKQKIYKLPKEFTTKWLKDLRSGKYEQANGTLKELVGEEEKPEYSYCCLGVACKTVGMPDGDINGGMLPCTPAHARKRDRSVDPTEKFFRKIPAKLRNNQALLDDLVGLNDDQGYSFKRIATWIEKNVELV